MLDSVYTMEMHEYVTLFGNGDDVTEFEDAYRDWFNGRVSGEGYQGWKTMWKVAERLGYDGDSR